MAGRRPGVPAAATRQPAQLPVAALHRARRDFHARRLGIPVVRVLGPRVPHDPVLAVRPRHRQAPAQAPAAGMVYAPQRAAARLRVEFRRPQPAGLRVGRAPDVFRGRAAHGNARPHFSRARFPCTARQFHVVGERRIARRAARGFRRRLPRARQRQPFQPQRTAARGRLPGAERRHQLDGHVRC